MSTVTGQSRAKRRVRWIGAAIVLAAAVAGGIMLAVAGEETTTTIKVVTVAVDRGEVTLDVATTGTVEPATTRSLSFAVDGTVASVAVRAGNKVKAGDQLAVLDKTGATEDVSDAREKLADARERLAAADDNAAAATASATACAVATPAGPPVVVAAEPSAAATVQAAATPCVTRGFPVAGNDQVLSAEQAANNAEVALAKAEEALAGTVIKAPIAGTVVSIAGSVGDKVTAGATFVGLADTYDMQVSADFPEADAGSLAKGQSGTVTLADSDATYAAKVVQVDPVGTSDGTLVRYGVLLAFTDAPSELLVGQSAQVRVRTGEVAAAIRVPSTAVHDVAGESGTVLVRSGGASVERTVAVGLRGGQYTEITDGLREGELVVRSW
ncbi:efflux RND transporter periplasmic adaptor subunit [Actinoplanes sp. NPDC023936]|uniref:efflux RND transporter periplasmic adaptor subunit n=1 Tax=Actinoplanes sp. NPDC023936 TaxID=3154910 RepID=UPI0033FF64D3